MALDDSLETAKNDYQKDHKSGNGALRNSFYRDMCSMYESRLKFYKDNIGKKTEFNTMITERFINNYEKSYGYFRKRHSL